MIDLKFWTTTSRWSNNSCMTNWTMQCRQGHPLFLQSQQATRSTNIRLPGKDGGKLDWHFKLQMSLAAVLLRHHKEEKDPSEELRSRSQENRVEVQRVAHLGTCKASS